MDYKELQKYRTHPSQWSCDRKYSTEKEITLRGSNTVIGKVHKQMDETGRVWWVANGLKFDLLLLAGDLIYTQSGKHAWFAPTTWGLVPLPVCQLHCQYNINVRSDSCTGSSTPRLRIAAPVGEALRAAFDPTGRGGAEE